MEKCLPYVIMQGVDLNTVPTVEAPSPKCAMLPIERYSSRDYQISLIEARGPHSRGVQMLRAGLPGYDKTYGLQPVTAAVHTHPLNAQGLELHEANQLDASTTLKGSISIARPLATREYQLAVPNTTGPNARGVAVRRAGLADVANTQPLEPIQPTVSLPVDATTQIRNSDGQYYRLYPKYGTW